MPATSPPAGWVPLDPTGDSPSWNPDPGWEHYDLTLIAAAGSWYGVSFNSGVFRNHPVANTDFDALFATSSGDAFVENPGGDFPKPSGASGGARHATACRMDAPLWVADAYDSTAPYPLTESRLRLTYDWSSDLVVSNEFSLFYGGAIVYTAGGGWAGENPDTAPFLGLTSWGYYDEVQDPPHEGAPPSPTTPGFTLGQVGMSGLDLKPWLRLFLHGDVASWNTSDNLRYQRTWRLWNLRLEVCSAYPPHVPSPAVGGFSYGYRF